MSYHIVPRYLPDGNSLADVHKPDDLDTPAAVPRKNILAPPTYAESVLPQLTAGTGKVIETLDKFLSLPFADSMKVTNKDGMDINVRKTVLEMKRKYESLQDESLVTIRDLSTYSTLQLNYIPKLNIKGNFTPQDYLSSNILLVLKFQKATRSIASKTAKITEEFKEFLEVLGANLVSVKDCIEKLDADIRDKEREYSDAKLAAILEGVLGLVFTVAGIALLATGVGAPWVPSLALAAVASFTVMVQHAVTAGRLIDLIGILKGVLKTCINTKNSLEQMIPLMEEVVTLMGGIINVWDEVKGDLDDLKSNTSLWFTRKMINAQSIKMATDSWAHIVANCAEYVNVVNGYKPTGNALKKPVETFDYEKAAFMMVDS